MADPATPPSVRLEPWSDADLELERRINSAEMKVHLGGPDPDEQIVARHRRFLELPTNGIGRMFRIVLLPDGEPVGGIGYWERSWHEVTVYEMGWSVLTAFQGRGIATTATAAAVASARADRKHRYVHAFPSITNPGSNAICRKLGFILINEIDFEYPPGTTMRCNDWRLDLNVEG